MIDWERVTGFEWDEGNARKSADKHGVSQSEAEQVFFNEPLMLMPDLNHSLQEPRFHALGKTDEDKHLHITFTARRWGLDPRDICPRHAPKREERLWQSQKRRHRSSRQRLRRESFGKAMTPVTISIGTMLYSHASQI